MESKCMRVMTHEIKQLLAQRLIAEARRVFLKQLLTLSQSVSPQSIACADPVG